MLHEESLTRATKDIRSHLKEPAETCGAPTSRGGALGQQTQGLFLSMGKSPEGGPAGGPRGTTHSSVTDNSLFGRLDGGWVLLGGGSSGLGGLGRVGVVLDSTARREFGANGAPIVVLPVAGHGLVRPRPPVCLGKPCRALGLLN